MTVKELVMIQNGVDYYGLYKADGGLIAPRADMRDILEYENRVVKEANLCTGKNGEQLAIKCCIYLEGE